jgi:mRNA interferase MazF
MSAPTSRSEFASFDVVVVPFPYAERLAEKRRPAVVVSAPDLQRTSGLTWLAMVTSAENPRWQHDVDVSDLKSAGLPAPSLLRPAKIATVDASRILRRIGRLTAQDARLLIESLQALMAN